ncbi:hypothetical protein, partial [Acinetobacter sp. ABJ_C5_2]|uniref:hypothetical protein n=1 Tax=Acinetobacter sp. ABJ_C5_2 TaxID=3376992 RepID=UPI0037C67E94
MDGIILLRGRMIKFKTLIKINDDFIDINDIAFSYQVKNVDWEYVEGKIVIFYYEKEIFGSNVVDDINWFWGFIADGFEEFFKNGNYDIYFPSQPIRFTIMKLKINLINLKISSEEVIYLNKDFNSIDFLRSLFSGAINYFNFEKRFNEDEIIEMDRRIKLI